MKNHILIALFSLISLTNCSIDGDKNTNVITKTYWHLRNVSGGIAGIDDDFNLEEIIWYFNDQTGRLTIINTNTENTIEDGLETGEYSFSVTTDETNNYLIIGDNEYGGLVVNNVELIINQNITSNGSGADGFVYTFQKVIVVED